VYKTFGYNDTPAFAYTKEEILKAAELGEVSMIDANHIVSLLDEAKTLLGNIKNEVTCVSCEKKIEYSSGYFTCADCSS
jgi:Zn finger protein HypA/HybF involved in hydrogenase expression